MDVRVQKFQSKDTPLPVTVDAAEAESEATAPFNPEANGLLDDDRSEDDLPPDHSGALPRLEVGMRGLRARTQDLLTAAPGAWEASLRSSAGGLAGRAVQAMRRGEPLGEPPCQQPENSPASASSERSGDAEGCQRCLLRAASFLCYPCGHLCLCIACAEEVALWFVGGEVYVRCPRCQAQVDCLIDGKPSGVFRTRPQNASSNPTAFEMMLRSAWVGAHGLALCTLQ
jgi:hypothetical protein